ncbi:MAG: DUF4350 domain-containing protein [Alphaproteobacteria bacterium]
MAKQPVFSPRTVAILITCGILAFAGAAYFAISDDQPGTSGANVFSTSAVGHRAFLEFLQRRGIPTVVSRNNSAAKAGGKALLILAEPNLQPGSYGLADRTLLILPKWAADADPAHPGWVRDVAFQPRKWVEHVIRQFDPNAVVIREPVKIGWNEASAASVRRFNGGRVDNDTLTNRIRGRAVPEIEGLQLIRSSVIEPIVSAWEGILVGAVTVQGRTLFVVSDPDLLSNAGIGRGDHAALMLDMIELMRPKDGTVVIDEVIHGFFQTPSLWRTLFRLPFLAATVTAIAALGILVWAASSRFGAALPAPRRGTATESDLIENAIDLLQQAGHEQEVARAYPGIVLRELAQQLHAPRHMNAAEQIRWIDRIGAARRMEPSFEALYREASAAPLSGGPRLLRAMQRLHHWKQEMIHGPRRH